MFFEYAETTKKVMELHTKLESDVDEFPKESQSFILDMVSTVAYDHPLEQDEVERIDSMWDRYIQFA